MEKLKKFKDIIILIMIILIAVIDKEHVNISIGANLSDIGRIDLKLGKP